MSLTYMLLQVVDVDYQVMISGGDNGFSSVDDILTYYKKKSDEYIIKAYYEYYGLIEES